MDQELPWPRAVGRAQADQGRGRGDHLQAQQPARGPLRAAGEGDDEGDQIELERQHPEEWGRRHLGGDAGGHPEQQARRRSGQKQPGQSIAPRRRRPLRRRDGGMRARRRRASPRPQGRAGEQQAENRIGEAPDLRLGFQAERGFDQRGIGGERQHAAEVTGHVKAIGIAPALSGPGEPCLQQRRGGRQRRERRTHGQAEHAEQPQRRRPGRGRAEGLRHPQRQGQGGQRQHAEMDRRLPADRADPLQQMRIGVAHEQCRLEEGQGGVPHRGRPPEQGQQQLADQWLDQEDQARTGKHRRGEQPVGQGEALRRFPSGARGHAHYCSSPQAEMCDLAAAFGYWQFSPRSTPSCSPKTSRSCPNRCSPGPGRAA